MSKDNNNNTGISAENMPSWKNRRRTIFCSLFFCACCVIYIMLGGEDTRINESIVLGCFGLAGSIIGFYVGGAAWEDISLYRSNSQLNTNHTPRTDI